MNDLFLRACAGKPVERTPVWIMRQAGRYLPEYRALREQHDFWEMCTTPELAAEITLQPIRRLGVDAAILFSDILVPLAAMGMDVKFTPAPEIDDPIRSASDVDRLGDAAGSDMLERVAQAVRLLRKELDQLVPLIGFGGAPFTVATYAVEGGGSKQHAALRAMLFGSPAAAHRLLQKLTDAVVASLQSQIEAGVQAVQLFDSWAGRLSPIDYETFALPYARQVFERIPASDIPRIYFAPGASPCLASMKDVGASVIGIDWQIPLSRAREVLEDRLAVQGNLDPGVLLGTPALIQKRTQMILEQARGARGHVMNLGHGILPQTPVENTEAFVQAVHQYSGRETADD
jgi:uroporphyrinogen decarboxylase